MTHQMVPMQDGTRLATDVYLTRDRSPNGVILLRTPYNKNMLIPVGFASVLLKDYPMVIQDMRGRFASEGNDTGFRNEQTDGPDTLTWIAAQTWSNGKIATIGPSALGIPQYLMAGANPQYLACQCIQVATPNLYKHAIYQGGEFRKELVENWLQSQGSMYLLPELFSHENYSLAFWTNVSLDDNWPDVNVPAMHVGGWYDCFQQGITDGFNGYQHLSGVGARGKSKLVIGPWTHTGLGVNTQGQLTYPENSNDNFTLQMFFEMAEQYTMNGPDTFSRRPNVTYYVLGDTSIIDAPGNEWRVAEDWPVPAQQISWYFQGDDLLNTTVPQDNMPRSYLYDPTNPVPTVGGQNLNIPAGPYDQSSVETRDDVLIFTSPILTEPYEATGPVKAHLFVSSDRTDTDFTVKLSDVYPDGRSMLITDGVLRMRNRNGTDHWELMEPGTIYEIDVDLWSTSYIWNTGHQIRVTVSSSNYPRFLPNPNTGDAMNTNTTYAIANNTLYLDTMHPSCLILPWVEPKPLNTPPLKPGKPSGPISGKTGIVLEYTANATDPDGDSVYLLFNWSDGTSSGWIGPYASDKSITVSHIWKKPGTYNIFVKVKDNNGSQSAEWSDPLVVKITGKMRGDDAPLNRLQKFLASLESLSKQ